MFTDFLLFLLSIQNISDSNDTASNPSVPFSVNIQWQTESMAFFDLKISFGSLKKNILTPVNFRTTWEGSN